MSKSVDISLDDYKKIFEDSESTFDEHPSKWLSQVRDKLFSMFCSPMKEEYTSEAFKWVSQLCISIGDFSWITVGNKWTQDEARIFSCIARLSLSETQILLPLMQRHLTFGDAPDIEDGKVLARSASHDDYDRFGTHLVIIECIIKSLLKDQEETDFGVGHDGSEKLNPVTDAIKADELQSLLKRLKETIESVCKYLETIHRHWQVITSHVDSDIYASAEGCLRIISVWLSEDPVSFVSECKRFLIDLMIKKLLSDNGSGKNDLIILALHSICAENDDMVQALEKVQSYDKALDRYLKAVKELNKNSVDIEEQKISNLRCGLVKDLLDKIKEVRHLSSRLA